MLKRLIAMIALGTGTLLVPLPVLALQQNQAQAAEDAEVSAPDRLAEALKRELGRIYPGARIELMGAIQMSSGSIPDDFGPITFRGETPRSELLFALQRPLSSREATGRVGFAARMPARIALKRILPGQRLSDELFKVEEVNIATGQAREYRGVILEPEAALSRLEARQTVLEGQFLVSTAVQHVPDVRRGDSVRVNLISGSLSLSTVGTAEEPAYLNGQVRVMTGKNKREIVGRLAPGGVVEVNL